MPEDFSDTVPVNATVATYGGHIVDIANPTVEMIREDDVIKSLARRPRYGGFLDTPLDELYVVAQHAVYVSRVAGTLEGGDDPLARYHALHHDDPEYILMDVVSPMKRILPDYKALEKLWTPITNQFFGVTVTPEFERLTHEADFIVFMMEAHEFDRIDVPNRFDYPKLFEAFPGDRVLKPSEAYQFYLDELNMLRAEITQMEEVRRHEEAWTA